MSKTTDLSYDDIHFLEIKIMTTTILAILAKRSRSYHAILKIRYLRLHIPFIVSLLHTCF